MSYSTDVLGRKSAAQAHGRKAKQGHYVVVVLKLDERP